jgi:hypothetical protein
MRAARATAPPHGHSNAAACWLTAALVCECLVGWKRVGVWQTLLVSPPMPLIKTRTHHKQTSSHTQLWGALAATAALMCHYNVREATARDRRYYCYVTSFTAVGSAFYWMGRLDRVSKKRRNCQHTLFKYAFHLATTTPVKKTKKDHCGGVGAYPTRFNISAYNEARCPQDGPGAAAFLLVFIHGRCGDGLLCSLLHDTHSLTRADNKQQQKQNQRRPSAATSRATPTLRTARSGSCR